MTTAAAIAIIAGFLVCAYFVGRALGRIESARTRSLNLKTWTPLVSILGQSAPSETGVMRGLYKGRSVRVRRGEKQSSDQGIGWNFEIELEGARGLEDWDVAYFPLLAVSGKPRGTITAADRVLRTRLETSGVLETIDAFGVENVTHIQFRAKREVLVYNESVLPRLVPTPERFKAQVDLLIRLDAINQQVQA